jgi:hypothetical protein
MRTSKKKITVTAADIQNGVREDGNCCAIALAARRVFHSRVEEIAVEEWLTVGARTFTLPKNAIRFMDRFDNGQPVRPFSFIAVEQDVE